MSQEEFLNSPVSQDMAKWNFYVVAQACLDLGNHIISIKGFEMPERYEDIIAILAKEKVISDNLAKSLEGMGGFRNLIAHGYFKIDLNKLYGYLRKTKNIKKFLERIDSYL
ncbi:MAG: hypothetical protein A3I73_04235 [Omnitrophica bacterium RIFCSPLOWO2_02_FULL_45_16]|nr:MAG: hypothetical protein A3I73_04235 [Omnitrophica bacterium RIFCSPLOWO2_02_FULL_45_16]